MDSIITEWALDSYLDLLGKAFSKDDYRQTIRPDVRKLRSYPNDTEFSSNKFWSPANEPLGKGRIPHGFKMKWHNIGPGKVQLRLPVGIFAEAFLCEAYVKEGAKQEKRKLARFKVHLQLLQTGRFTERGRLP